MKMFKAWFDVFSKPATGAVDKPSLSQEDRAVIVEFAKGAEELRSKAINIHRANIGLIGVRGDVFQCFMAEVDNPVPDYAQRHAYRQAVLSAAA